MELKSRRAPTWEPGKESSNRTFMELKCKDGVPEGIGIIRSNRTFMELKYRDEYRVSLDIKF